jgi:transcriptional regulator with XRE-family HTH domain
VTGVSTGQRIAQLRKARGWTQAALAARAGLSSSTIAMYETGRRTPDAQTLARIAKALDVSLADLGAAADPADVPASSAGSPDARSAAAQPSERSLAAEANAAVSAASEPQPQADPYVTLDLTRDEARIILFLRLNPDLMPFFRAFVTAEPRRRQQLLKTWDLIHRFQN